jgi:formylglycine-generating enzyme required for sulfatase activity
VREREAGIAGTLAGEPEELVRSLRGRVARLRERMGRDAVLWRSDVQQLDDFERLLARASAELAERATFRFADPLDAWRHDALRRLVDDLARLGQLVPRVRAQIEATEELARRFDGDGADTWRKACSAIRASPRYGGLELAPVFGVEPLGENAAGLWEFLVLASGTAPVHEGRGASDERGGWRMDSDSGIVLVLLPGGRFTMGQRPDEGPPAFSSQPLHEVELAPFFVSRYELTVGQAERLGGFPPEKTPPHDGRLPLVLDWERARELLHRHGLELPTEAQWEYAARAGSDVLVGLEGRANVHDLSRESGLAEERAFQDGAVADFDDGFSGVAPIGSFLSNDFGLFDTLGNVSEWCLDAFVLRGYSTLAPRSGDGLRATVVSAQLRVVRGGSCVDGPGLCQPYRRLYEVPSKMPYFTGVRPVRSLSPD